MAKDKKPSNSKSRKGRTPESFRQIGNDEVDRWAVENFDGPLYSLPTNELRGLQEYTGGGYTEMNKFLRGNSKNLSSETKAAMEGAISALNRMSAPESIVAFRGFQSFGIFNDLGSLKSGTVFQDNGFHSTAVDANKAFSGNIRVEVRIPKGTKGAYVDHISSNQGEKEFLLPPGTKFRVVSASPSSGFYGGGTMVVEVVGSKTKAIQTHTPAAG